MAYRLIFTSSPRALTGGRSGFCTVARSKSMSEKLASLVEKCGTYEHEKNMGAPIFLHKNLFFAGQNYHVLSRISEAAPDYTNRSNYLAEHIVIPDTELAELPTPAEILLNKKDWLDKWDGEPQWLDDVTIEKSKPQYAPPAKNWQAEFGDAGKADLLQKNAPAIFAYPQDAELLLKLFAESASLQTPIIRAWDYTFTTSFTDSENPSDYSWRAYANPSEDKMAANPQAVNLIKKSSPPAPNSPFANYARTGQISNRDRLGLKVGTPAAAKPRIHVAYETKKTFPLIPIVAASVLSMAGLVATIMLYNPDSQDDGADFPTAQTRAAVPNSFAPQNSEVAQPHTKILADVKDALENRKWQKALDIWDTSNAKQLDPKGRAQILSDIGKYADKLMDSAEKYASGVNKNPDGKLAAIENLHAAKSALETDAIAQKEERLERWRKLEQLIKKL